MLLEGHNFNCWAAKNTDQLLCYTDTDTCRDTGTHTDVDITDYIAWQPSLKILCKPCLLQCCLHYYHSLVLEGFVGWVLQDSYRSVVFSLNQFNWLSFQINYIRGDHSFSYRQTGTQMAQNSPTIFMNPPLPLFAEGRVCGGEQQVVILVRCYNNIIIDTVSFTL